MRICKRWGKKKKGYFPKLHLIMDNKQFDVPCTARAKRYAKMRKVRFHIRRPGVIHI